MVEAKRRLIRRVLQRQPDGGLVLHYQPDGVVNAADDTEDAWPGVRDDIAEMLGVKPERVTRDTWLVRDLGLSS